MTIIASYDIYGCKVLLADTLITSQKRNENKLTLPTLGKIDSTKVDSDVYIYGNLQKIQILSDYCAIAYAGNVSLAHQFITTLNDILKERTLLISDIESTYKDIDGNSDLAIIYLYNAGDEKIISGGINCVNARSDVLGEVIYRGSGEQAITDYIEWLDNNTDRHIPSSDEVVANGVRVAIQQIAQLQLAEISSNNTPESIKDYFGSGYEIVSFYDGKFNKIDLTYAFIELTYNPHTSYVNINHPYLILSNYIEGGFLVHDRYQQVNYDHLSDSDFVEYHYNQVLTPSLLNVDKAIPTITQENKLDTLNFCCFVFHDNFKYGYEMWQSIVMRSDTPPISVKKCNEENLYQVDYSVKTENQIIDFIEKNYL
ncbi:hypothetical protein H4F51_13230 [Pectobacterium brasiliense]|uniref:hypothetical protein n=1 Tax=Pectobacterium brasiliense TaxID=180957 RepID=UPI0015DE0B60|nr:hypothetical protein [Pectobacterium brasiliense]MBA0197659.1 hypothetical protein [Pectobacterium brasiliense]MBN3093530.1 hypothetical protein [Pectobacterium brasiliense]MBN3140877.1 hypothetical protein [Pectobacterium brasiliense]MBW5896634.1 hypothetical protein [Pectobacterium brasiliense]